MLIEKIQELREQNKPVRLHLGCGTRVFDDYLNIDGDYMAGTPGIFVHDISQPFPVDENSVDEILSIHVIEHIMPDQVPGILREWLRMLKPGGCVAIEWPDLLKMCQYIASDPSRIYSTDRKVQKRSVGGIFGNIIRYQDPVMLHKWGYSEESLGLLLKQNGYTNVRSEPNHYPKTEMCSRVVGFKCY